MNKKRQIKRPTYVLLDQADYQRIEQRAEQEGLSGSAIIRRILMRELRGLDDKDEA